MLAGLTKSAINLMKSNNPEPGPAPTMTTMDVHELLTALSTVRAKIADLTRQEKEILAATAVKLREHEVALEELKKKVQGCGIDLQPRASCAPPVSPSESAERQPASPTLVAVGD